MQYEEEDRADLYETVVSTMREKQDELRLHSQAASASAVCAVAVPALVSLSESEFAEDTLVVIADSSTAPQWTDDSRVAALSNTLTALTIARVPVANTSIDVVLKSLSKIVTITPTPSEAEMEFTLRPRNFLRPRMVEVPTSSGDNADF